MPVCSILINMKHCTQKRFSEAFPSAGVILCLERALSQAGLKPEDVSYVNAHATSTLAGDMAEYRALRKVFPHEVR
jgi:3-oxoacyl-[acyl-carrier-protein] synthase II